MVDKPVTRKTFARDATGLVREIGFFDHLVTNMNGVVPLISMTLTSWWIWYAVPGGDPVLAITVGYFLGLIGTFPIFAMMNATFPRSAAPYVAYSRVLHPAIGWPAEVLQWLSWGPGTAPIVGLTISWGLIPGLYTMGVSSGNSSLIAIATALTQPMWAFVLLVIIITITFLFAVAGTRRLIRTFNLPMTVLMFVGIVLILWIWSTTNATQIDPILMKYLGADTSSIVAQATSANPQAMMAPTYSVFAVMAGIGFSIGQANCYWNSWAAGEVKHGNDVKMHYFSMVIPSTVIFLLIVGITWIAQATVGRTFLVALTQILSTNPGYFSHAPLVAYMSGSSALTFIPMMVADNTAIQLIITAGIVASSFVIIPVGWLIASRQWFAWSFDRLVPLKFADVSDRFGTPVFNLFVQYVIMIVFGLVVVYLPQYLGFYLASEWVESNLPVMILCLAGAILPFRKYLWENSPAKKYRVGPVPLIAIAGLVGVLYEANGIWFFTTTPSLGFGLPSTEILIAIFIAPFILYWVIRAVRIKQGIDIDAIFRTIPPE